MSASGQRQRTVCADCGNRTRVAPSEFSMDDKYKGYRVQLYRVVDLCPICRSGRRSWWTLNGRPVAIVHLPR